MKTRPCFVLFTIVCSLNCLHAMDLANGYYQELIEMPGSPYVSPRLLEVEEASPPFSPAQSHINIQMPENCNICFEMIDQPDDEHSGIVFFHQHNDVAYHQRCLQRWLSRNPTCPECRYHIGGVEVQRIVLVPEDSRFIVLRPNYKTCCRITCCFCSVYFFGFLVAVYAKAVVGFFASL